MPGGERPPGDWFDREEVFRRLRQMTPGELVAVLAQVDEMERAAVEGLDVQADYTAEVSQVAPLATQSATATFTVPDGIESKVEVGEAHAMQGVVMAHGSASGTITWTGTAHGYAPPVPTPTEAVASLWELVKPKNTQDALGISRDLRRWVLILFFIIVGGAKTPAILDAIQREFVADTVQEEVLPKAATEGDSTAG